MRLNAKGENDLVEKTFVVEPPLKMVSQGHFVMIDGKYYRVLSGPSWTTDEKTGKIISWGFKGQLITNEKLLKVLREGKIALLPLESKDIKEVY